MDCTLILTFHIEQNSKGQLRIISDNVPHESFPLPLFLANTFNPGTIFPKNLNQ